MKRKHLVESMYMKGFQGGVSPLNHAKIFILYRHNIENN